MLRARPGRKGFAFTLALTALAVAPAAAWAGIDGGSLGNAVLSAHHDGSGPVKGRQDSAHVHSTVTSPDGRYLFTQELGTDKLYVYRYMPDDTAYVFRRDPDAGILQPNPARLDIGAPVDFKFAPAS